MNRNTMKSIGLSVVMAIMVTFTYSVVNRCHSISVNPILKENIEVLSESEGGKECMEGGEGATSCSYGFGGFTCSVSCESGYYACCGMTGCKCKSYK